MTQRVAAAGTTLGRILGTRLDSATGRHIPLQPVVGPRAGIAPCQRRRRTVNIEMVHVAGVHGPRRLEVIIVGDDNVAGAIRCDHVGHLLFAG